MHERPLIYHVYIYIVYAIEMIKFVYRNLCMEFFLYTIFSLQIFVTGFLPSEMGADNARSVL